MKLRHELTALPKKLAKTPGTVAVTRRGKPVLAILPWHLYESLVETLDILEDEDLMAALRRGVAEAEAGKSICSKKLLPPALYPALVDLNLHPALRKVIQLWACFDE